uniref:Uncharacterized protein n=1 Tax=Tanacetum cinerariifolium TaxID=118510 RepID=A0A699GU68_TANCI|nr:hypothetical protein [Tanacetum cinerariifolium]
MTLRKVDHNSAIRASIKSEVLTVVREYLGTSLDDTLHKSILKDEDSMDKGVADKSKRKPDDVDRDEVPPIGPDQGLKRKKTSKDIESSKKAKQLEPPKAPPKSTGNSVQAEETVFEADPKDWFKKPKRPPTPDPEWNECKIVDSKPTQKSLSDLSKVEKPSKTFVNLMSTPIDFNTFAMNRLHISDLTQGGSTDRTYTTSLTKTKAAKYDLQGIEDMDKLKDMLNKLEMGYTSVMPKRIWSNLDKKRYIIMVKDIYRQLLERRLMRSLEKFVGGREYGEDLRLL